MKRSYLRWTGLYYIFPLSQAGFLNDYVGVDIAEWMLLCADDAPVQSNGVDYGIFVMKHIEAIYKVEKPFFDAVWALYPLLLGIPAHILVSHYIFLLQEDIPELREEICGNLIEFKKNARQNM